MGRSPSSPERKRNSQHLKDTITQRDPILAFCLPVILATIFGCPLPILQVDIPLEISLALFIDLMQLTSSPYVTKRETDSGWKARYYAAILSGKNDRGQWSGSTTEQFASSFLTSTRSDFTFTPRMHKVSTGPNAHWKRISLPACRVDAVSL